LTACQVILPLSGINIGWLSLERNIEMRRIVAFGFWIVFGGLMPVVTQIAKPEPAEDILNAALKEASATGKNVLLIFSASWCGWCRQLDKMLDNPEIKPIIVKDYVVARLDILEGQAGKQDLENPGGLEIAAKLGTSKPGLPYYAFLNSKGNKLADSNVMPGGQGIGFPATNEEIVEFRKLLQKTAPKMSDQDRDRIIGYLEKMKKN
jgi:thioredoxin-related protein